ncbi:MAG: glyoxalase, partial [Gammaproteobacteria bacterium]|nr:glyoxalase [Gemmatimonadota bacterium]NIR39394.1 glyoxalase [Actinomycetota bacterium]NIU77524.1 glyoxalase [Gammaproteobacteria bacterium]NIX23172.1 glyoxalase [Actinomycetota bacterium]
DDGYPAFSIHVDTDDPDAVFAQAAAAGATIVREISDSPYGTRGFVARDPEGLYWSFG